MSRKAYIFLVTVAVVKGYFPRLFFDLSWRFGLKEKSILLQWQYYFQDSNGSRLELFIQEKMHFYTWVVYPSFSSIQRIFGRSSVHKSTSQVWIGRPSSALFTQRWKWGSFFIINPNFVWTGNAIFNQCFNNQWI